MQRLPKLNFTTTLFSLIALWSTPSFAESILNLTRGVTPISRDIYDLHMTIFWICVVVGIVVFAIMFYALIHHRRSKGHRPASFHENTTLEIIWTAIPFLVLVAMATPATFVLVRMNDYSKADLTIKVVGYQWKWKYEYLDKDISFFSTLDTPADQLSGKAKKNPHYLLQVDNPLVLPTHKKIRFLITSKDVIHSWYVPALGVKRDSIPGYISEAWARINKEGTYRGQCAELCGKGHGYMPIVVHAIPEKDFERWVKEQKMDKKAEAAASNKNYSFEELMTLGKEKYERACAICHRSDGSGMPPAFPGLRGSSVCVGKPISKHIEIVLNGVPGTAMQAFGPQLNDRDLAAIITYERNAWGNDTGDLVQPLDVKAVRNGKESPADQPPLQKSPKKNQPPPVKKDQSA